MRACLTISRDLILIGRQTEVLSLVGLAMIKSFTNSKEERAAGSRLRGQVREEDGGMAVTVLAHVAQ